jgi:hypothetical protein
VKPGRRRRPAGGARLGRRGGRRTARPSRLRKRASGTKGHAKGQAAQRGTGATECVGPNGIRPSGRRRWPLQDAQDLRCMRRRLRPGLQRTKSSSLGVGARNSLKLNERTGNVLENKGPLGKSRRAERRSALGQAPLVPTEGAKSSKHAKKIATSAGGDKEFLVGG